MVEHPVFLEVTILLALAAGLGLLGLALRQPLIVAFLAVGIVAGPGALGVIRSTEYVGLLAEIGVSVLLFVVGLKLDLGLVRTLGKVAVATGLGQVSFTSLFGLLLCLALGLDLVTSVYVAVALTFSSTIIIVKLLSDKREVDALHGRIALGFLIVQDLVVVFAMIALSTLGVGLPGAEPGASGALLRVLGGGAVLLVVLLLFIRFLAERLLSVVARVPELLVTFGIAWAVGLAAVTDLLGLGKELGGLLAGVAFASTSFRDAVASRLGPLRDFLLLFFFVGLGMQLELALLGAQVPAAVALSLFVLIGNPLIVMVIMGYMGYRKRTGFLAGLTVAQISEFSLIFMAMGRSLGHVQAESIGLVTLVGLLTITLSTYMILYSQALYRWCEPLLGPFERRVPYREEAGVAPAPGERADVVMIGLGRYGRSLTHGLEQRGLTVVGVDVDPEVVRARRAAGRPALYGDAADPGLVAELPLAPPPWVVIAVPPHPMGLSHADPRRALLHALRERGVEKVGVIARDEDEAGELARLGAALVLQPFPDAAVRAVERITSEMSDALARGARSA
ncbi:MAG: cation:proton antiporter [Planctomycetes bacterium]|nr:cation:proton antiporter [Planctomycetota bacterium]